MSILYDMEEAKAPSSSPPKNAVSLRTLVKTRPEGRVLVIGTALTLLYILWLGIKLISNPERFHVLIGMTATEVVFGRIGCMTLGFTAGLNHTFVILISMFLETLLVLLFYPLFVFTWEHLLVLKWLKRFSERTHKAAKRHKDKVGKYGVIGLFTFVWLPFWMTGPVVGCMIGYLLGIRVWVNVLASLVGTYVAILGWAYLLQKTLSFSSYATVIIAAIVATALLAWACHQRFRKHPQ